MANYYDLDDIIMEDELVSVVFQVGANGVGLLDPGAETNNIQQGAKVELPFWLSQELQLRQAASINLPACFNQKTRKEVQADVAYVNLKNRCPYFYEFGCKVAPLVGDRTIGSFLLYAFKGRYKEVLSKAHSAAYSVAPKFLPLLTKEETQLYDAAQSSMTAYKKWRVGGPRFERASILKKRKSNG
ncbi:hypothetical protein C5167_003490 [Papaver somniferum]|uniref:Uncharacterized protein n=1 Tax=Papaver somniferum TaxID=3469 RepID=A0A4Y7L4C7_PAPSO|nr:DNA replication complex GINS protein PSF3-like [Papaver somniferum]RZC79278.1 hypothetical protein C5167_003490 [Papaver somniferum]